MATAQSVIQKLQNLLRIAQDTTGQSHPDLQSAVQALVKGYGSGNHPTVYQGQYTVAGSGSDAVFLKIVHNFGAYKPFSLFLCPKGKDFPSASMESVYKVQLYVPTVSPESTDISYGPNHSITTMTNNPVLSVHCMDGSGFECAYNPLNYYSTDPGCAQKLGVAVWPNGFYVGLPRNLDPSLTYDYTIVWGV